MAAIGEKALTKAADLIKGHLFDYSRFINEAYHEIEGPLTVNLPVKFSPNGSGVQIDTKITFKTGEIKDAGKAVVDENQPDMFDEQAAKRRKWLELLLMDFSEIRRQLMIGHEQFMAKYRRDFVFSKFERHSL